MVFLKTRMKRLLGRKNFKDGQVVTVIDAKR